MSETKNQRCFGHGKDFYERYHDQEWGVPVYDDSHLFEMLCLEGAQAGLHWEMILKRREGYRSLFHSFDPLKVSRMGESELESNLKDPSIIRNRKKVWSMRENAKVFLKIQQEFGSFQTYLWAFVDHKPIINQWKTLQEVPCRSEISDVLSKDLKTRGMSFVGTKIIYALMQAVGMVNDHLVSCPFKKK